MDSLLVLAKPDADQERILAAIASTSRLELVTCNRVEAAIAWLDAHDPRVVVFDASLVRAEKLCHKVRSKKSLSSVPLIALTSDTSDTLIERLYSLGVDDVVSSTLGPGFVARLRTLPDRLAQPPERGLAVVADTDRERCNVVQRVLANAGYDVKLAHDPVSLAFYTKSRKPRLVVGSASLGPPRTFISEARRKGCNAPWIVTATRRDLVKVAGGLAGLERVSVVNTAGAPETVLFVANELMRGELPPMRAEERQLYNTLVRFRSAREETDEIGFSYNVSQNGMFVRTLAAPENDAVWLEVRPPRCREWVRLEGRVAWRRAYVPTSAQLGPPGFGVAIQGGLADCLTLWKTNCDAFAQSMLASATGIAKLHTARREDARTSGEYMLLEVPSESRLAVVSVVSDASSLPMPSVPPPDSTSSTPPPRSISQPPSSPTLPLSSMPPLTSAAPPAPSAPPFGSTTLPLSSMPPMTDIEPPQVPEAGERAPSVPPEDLPEEDLEAVEETPPPPEPPPPPVRSAPKPTAPVVEPKPARPEPEAFSLTRPRSVPRSTAKRKRSRELPSVLGFLTLGLAAGALAAFLYPGFRGHEGGESPLPSVATVSATPAPVPVPSTITPVVSAPPLATAPTLEPPTDAGQMPDAAGLLSMEGYLVVRSSRAGDVYSTGFKIGSTNQPNKTHCGLRWVRLGTGEPPTWTSEGLTVDVKCGETTTIELEPSP